MRRFTLAILLAFPQLLSSACGQQVDTEEYLDIAELPERRLVEELRLGGRNVREEVSFQTEPQIAVHESGLLYVLHYQQGRVAVLDSAGRLVHWIGRKGSGPGEFQIALDFGFVGDTLWVRNVPTPRISRFLTDGTHLSTEPTSYDLGQRFSSPSGISGYLEHGRAWVRADGFVMGQDTQVQTPVLVGPRDMSNADTLFTIPNPRGQLGGVQFAPFLQPPFYTVARNGRRIAVADWDEAEPITVTVRLFTPAGANLSTWSLRFAPVHVPEPVRDSLIAAGIAAVERIAERLRERELPEGTYRQTMSSDEVAQEAYLPQYFPPIRRILFGLDDTVWLESMDHLEGGRWIVSDLEGNPQFRVNIPTRFTLWAASDRGVWATTMDSLDVPYIVKWRLRSD